MITVTFGTIPIPFNRMIDWIEQLLKENYISEPLLVQHGVSDVTKIATHPLVTTAAILDIDELEHWVNQSNFVIAHAGQGSTRWLAARKVRFVIVPRLAQYQEHVDDHQLLFAKSVEPFGVRYCTSLDELKQVVVNPPPPFTQELLSGPKLVEHLLESFRS